MFESSEDIVLDEDDDFFNTVFEKEQEVIGKAFSSGLANDLNLKSSHQPLFSVEDKELITKAVVNHQAGSTFTENHSNSGSKNELQQTCAGAQPDQIFNFNKENKRKLALSPATTKKKRERKFPGPAGLLPDRILPGVTHLKLDYLLEAEKSPQTPGPDEFCSQGRCSGSILEEEPWQNFLADLGPDKHILKEVNVASVKRKAAAKCFVGRKVPFLAAVLHHLDLSSPDPCIILRDSTGEIHGTLHREVWEQFAGELVVGSVLVVQNVGLLSTGLSSRRHYLNITANNLATIYSASPDKLRKSWLHPFTSQDFAQTIQNWRSLISPSNNVCSPAAGGSPALFNTSLCSPLNNNTIQRPVTPIPNASFGPRTADSSHRLISTPQGSNMRQTVPKVISFPENSQRHSTPLRTMSKNLLHSLSPKQSQPTTSFSSNNVPIVVPNVCRPKLFLTQTETTLTPSRNPSVCPNTKQSCSNVKKFAAGNSNNRLSDKSFEFNPVILQQKKFNSTIFPQTNSDRQLSSEVRDLPSTMSRLKTESCAVNSSKLMSQTSQLTAEEEQSVVESVFEGIDVDNLFDDDF